MSAKLTGTSAARSAFSLQEDPPSDPRGLPPAIENFEVLSRFRPVHPRTGPVQLGQIADVAVHKQFAYLNSWDDVNCSWGGTFIVDIRDPSQPRQVGFLPAPQPYYHGEGAHVISVSTPQFTGDLLAVNDETYGSNVNAPCAPDDLTGGGFDLWDVSNPHNPRVLVEGAGDTDPDNNPQTAPRTFANSYHSVFVWQDGPRAYLVASDNIELTDVDVFDITDPTQPEMIGDYDLAAMFPGILGGEQANGSNVFLHDMVVKKIGNRQVLKADYWDAGYVQLDVTDPANPTLITDTTYTGEDPLLPGSRLVPEGNGHQGEFSFDNQFLLAADEDFNAFRTVVTATSGATNGRRATATEGNSNARLSALPDGRANGRSVFLGNACLAAAVPAAPPDDANPNTDDIGLIERGGVAPDGTACGFALKFANATAKGWDVVVVFNQPRPDDGQVNMQTGPANIPGVHMRRVDALGANGVLSTSTTTPAAGTPGPDLDIGLVFDGWGYAHLYDANTSEHLDAFAIPEALDPRFADEFGDLSIHEFATDPTEHVAYSSYYAGGIRAFRFSRAGGLQQTAKFIDEGGSNFWGVEQFTTTNGERIVAGSDRDFGLVLLRYTGPGAPQRPSCANSQASTAPGQPVAIRLSCTDANGNPLTRRVVAAPSNGTLGAMGDTVTYTPNPGFVGTDSFTFAANDGAADSEPATVQVTVQPPVPQPGNQPRPSGSISIQLGSFRNGRVAVTATTDSAGRLRASIRLGTAARTPTLTSRVLTIRRPGTTRFTLKLTTSQLRRLRRVLSRSAGGRRRGAVRFVWTANGLSSRVLSSPLTLRR